MFFEGCPPHLGCSVKLRGASAYELARVKEIIMLMMCVAYHSQLEISFLMDEFAMPPSLAQSTSLPCLLEGTSTVDEADGDEGRMETSEESQESVTGVDDSALGGRPERIWLSSETDGVQDRANSKSVSSVQEDVRSTDAVTSTPFSAPPAAHLSVSPPFLMEEDEAMTHSDPMFGASEVETGEDGGAVKGDESPSTRDGEGSDTPRLFRDPLQDDTGLFVTEQVASSDDRLKSISALFKQELKDIILCISPFITFKEPFLLTPAGMHCPSRDYFPEQVGRRRLPVEGSFVTFQLIPLHRVFPRCAPQVYLSLLLNKDLKELDGRRKRQLLKDCAPSSLAGGQTNGAAPPRPVSVLPCHGLTSARIVEQLNSSQDLAEMLADYRAKGGRIQQREAGDPFSAAGAAKPAARSDSEGEKPSRQNDLAWSPKVSSAVGVRAGAAAYFPLTSCSGPQMDCLNPVNHQRLCVLFSSSSAQSNNAPNPCVSPWYTAKSPVANLVSCFIVAHLCSL